MKWKAKEREEKEGTEGRREAAAGMDEARQGGSEENRD